MGRKDIGVFICAGYLVRNRIPNKRFLFGEGADYIFRNLQGHLLGGSERLTCIWKVERI